MAEVTIYGVTFSPFVRKAMVLATEKGVDVANVAMSPRDIPDELKPHSPLGKIPFANVQGRWVADSTVICELLEDLYPDPPFYPADPYERARARWIDEYVDGGVIPNVGPKIVFQRVVRPLLMGEPCDESIVQDALDNILPRYAAYLEAELGNRSYFVGDTMTIADVTVVSFQVTLAHAGVVLDPAKYPNLARHRESILKRPSFTKPIEGEKAMLAQMKERAAATA